MSIKGAQLLYFVTVAEEGQITRAARRLNIAQPALSQSISSLEAELGFDLFTRHPRGVTLTASGETFFAKALAALGAAADAEDTARSLARAAMGELEVGFLATPPVLHTSGLFDELSRRHPEIECRFREMPFPAGTIASWLEGVDAAVAVFAEDEPGVLLEPLREEMRTLIVPATHRFAARGQVAVAETLDEVFLGIDPRVDPRWAGLWTLDDHRGGPPAHATSDQAGNAQDLLVMIASGRGVMALPACHAEIIASVMPNVAAVRIPDATPAIIHLIWREDSANRHVEALVTLVREQWARGAAARAPAAP